MDAKALERELKDVVPSDKLAEFWRDPKKSESYFKDLKARSIDLLSGVDLLKAIK